MQDDRTVTLPEETVRAIRDVLDAAVEAISELCLRATRKPHELGIPPGVEGFWRLHAKIVHGGDPDLLDIF